MNKVMANALVPYDNITLKVCRDIALVICKASWLSGKVLESELKGPGLNSHHGSDVVFLRKTLYSQFPYLTHV